MTRRHLQPEQMVISEEWRLRFLTLWVIVFTVLVSYAVFKIHAVSDDNRDALCAVHRTHLVTDNSLKLLLEKDGLDADAIDQEIAAEEAAISELGCES